MRYLITTQDTYAPFLTEWCSIENHFNPDVKMVVYDLAERKFTTDGKVWQDIETDHL